MKITEYNAFVRRTSQFLDKPLEEQRSIALYGLVGEIGSLVAAVKKKILAEGGEGSRIDQPNDEILEELGDCLWYCYSLAQALNKAPFDILASDIAALRAEIGKQDDRAKKIATRLDPKDREAFLSSAASFPPSVDYTFNDYQMLAFKTARTEGRVLLEVCLAVLWQLGAELLRITLPEIELDLNHNVADRNPNVVLGEITWHLSALASLYHVPLDMVIEENCRKVRFRAERGDHTLLHDTDREASEQFPRKFDVAFVQTGRGRSRMYLNGKPMGDDLTDNSREDDGYRFHDVIHLALVAHLGWSPVLRGFMKRKRKSRNDGVDEVEDGGRAQVVEELVIKAIHSEGARQAQASGRCTIGAPMQLFPERSVINFKLLKTLRTYVDGLEVAKNTFWEWEDAIFEGCQMFYRLCQEQQGTVTVDLLNRRLTFTETVNPSVQGISLGLGMGSHPTASWPPQGMLNDDEQRWAEAKQLIPETVAAKQAVLEALGLDKSDPVMWPEIEAKLLSRAAVSIKATATVRERVWRLKAVDYKVAFNRIGEEVMCIATAIGDVADASK